MKLTRTVSLGTTIEARATNRPVKIAYLVPFEDTPLTHMLLDAVFFESYTRWGGAYSLVVPTKPAEFIAAEYEEWLRHYDPDFVYTYVDLDAAFIEKIDTLCCPIAFLKHENRRAAEKDVDWSFFLARFDHYIQPVSSVTTIPSPAAYPVFPRERRESEPTVLTQYGIQSVNRFLADNFGSAFNVHDVLHSVPGYYKVLCLVPADLPANINSANERCTSTVEALRALTERKATTIARYAMAHSAGIPRAESMGWANASRLFVGSTPLDRVHFWNCRHLGSSWSDASNALILEPSFFDDEALVKQLGGYLNQTNFLGHGNGPNVAEFHSSSLSADVLDAFIEKLRPHTWNAVRVSRSFRAPAVPTDKDLEHTRYERSGDTATVKLTEDSNQIVASEPAHFLYIPPQLRGFARGQWVVDLSIQRHNNLSKFSNVVDRWAMPRRRKIARAFTQRLAKPTLGGRLALIPLTDSHPFRRDGAVREPSSYDLDLPTDESFFRHLALEFFRYPGDDVRASALAGGYVDLEVSDKGRNLRGVISMFEHLSFAYEILTNPYWRSVFARVKEESSRPLTFNWDKLMSLIPNDRPIVEKLTKELRLENFGRTKKYLRASLLDTLEYLMRANVFYQVAYWRCKYCGHANSRSFDNMKIRNKCDICEAEYLAPIDVEWQYELNNFVYRSLEKHHGRPVLWTLGYLQDVSHEGNFWYLPEVNLYESHDDRERRNEIDILCMLDGCFYAVEAKLSASMFLSKDGAVDKYLRVIERLRPDVALLAFERYCVEGEDADAVRKRLAQTVQHLHARVGAVTKVKLLVAEDVHGFNDFPASLGRDGRRVGEFE